jgi:hypothetical protein
MAVKFSNNAVTTLSASISAGATSFTVASASPFPTLASGDWTYVSLTSEVVKVTAISGTTFTCDATSDAHASGESVELRMTAELLNDFSEDTESLPIGGGTLTGNLNLGDNVKAQFGAGNDLQIYSDGANSFIQENGSGDLYIKATQLTLADSAGNNHLVSYSGGSTNLYNAGVKKLTTTSTGIDISGTTGDIINITTTSGTEAAIWVDGNELSIKVDADNDDVNSIITFDVDAAERLRVKSTGIDVTGNITLSSPTAVMVIKDNTSGPTTTVARISFQDYTNTQLGQIGFPTDGGNLVIEASNSNDIKFKLGGSERIRVTKDGDTGFGTSNPQSRIDVGGGYMANEQGRTDHVANTMPSPYYNMVSGQYADIGSSDEAKSMSPTFSFATSFRVTPNRNSGTNYALYDCEQYVTGGIICRVDGSGGTLLVRMSTLGFADSVTTSFIFDDDKVHHVAFVYDGVYGNLYIDGVFHKKAAMNHHANTGKNVKIGNSSQGFVGDIHSFKLYNTALTADEVKELYSGASVPFKYKGASQTELVTNGDMSLDSNSDGLADGLSFYSNRGDASIVTGNGFTGNAQRLSYNTTQGSLQAIRWTGLFVAGKKYRIVFKYRSSFGFGLSDSSYSFPSANWSANTGNATEVTYSFTYTGNNGSLQIPTWATASGQWFEISDLSVVQIGAVAEYDGSSATTSTWYDKSGNGLDGTVTGATLQNKVKALDGVEVITVKEKLTIDGSGNTHGIDIKNANSRLYFSGARAMEGGATSNLMIGEGFSTTHISSTTLSGSQFDFQSTNGRVRTSLNSSYSALMVSNSASGDAGIYMDASDGDFSGSDYMFIGQKDDKSGIIEMNPNAGDLVIKVGSNGERF